MKNIQKGFTLIEIVISISLLVLIMTVVMNGLGPWLKFKQGIDTEQTLTDLKNATETLYRSNAWDIMNEGNLTDRKISFYNNATTPALISLKDSSLISGVAGLNTYCGGTAAGSAGIDHPTISKSSANIDNLRPLSPFLSKSLDKVVTDGFNNTICVYVSPSIRKDYQGFPLFYNVIAFVSPGENGRIDNNGAGDQTRFYNNNGDWMLETGGDDKAVVFDGLKIALDGFKISQERLQKYAKAYETYFNIRFLTKEDRDITLNYFYASNGTNNGDTGNIGNSGTNSEIFLPQTKLDSDLTVSFADLASSNTITKSNAGSPSGADQFNYVLEPITPAGLTAPVSFGGALGISLEDSFNAWGKPIYIDNASKRVRSGVDNSSAPPIKNQPPFSATFGTFLPGTSKLTSTLCDGAINDASEYCPTFITSTSNGNY